MHTPLSEKAAKKPRESPALPHILPGFSSRSPDVFKNSFSLSWVHSSSTVPGTSSTETTFNPFPPQNESSLLYPLLENHLAPAAWTPLQNLDNRAPPHGKSAILTDSDNTFKYFLSISL